MKYNIDIVLAYWKSQGIPAPVPEHRFHDERKWRFDFAWPDQKVYLECDGGIWIKGGHNRGAQMKKDWEKRNNASMLGWRGIWCEPKDVMTFSMIPIIKECLKWK